jgi:Trehalase-like, N-terminal
MAQDVPAGRAVSVTSDGTRSPLRARYLPIAEHGLIGDRHTVALVGTDGTIDWYCCPRFDSPSVFAAILDADHGGLFRIAPDRDGWISKQLPLARPLSSAASAAAALFGGLAGIRACPTSRTRPSQACRLSVP